MDMLKQLNAAVEYIEAHLCDEVDMDALAQIACITSDSFLRFFSYMTGMTLREYLRRRRLTLAAYELRGGKQKVIDAAVKYGWDSADAFGKAFLRQHGITPSQAREPGCTLKAYPPASFYIMIKGAQEMNFRIIELEETAVYGLSKQFDGEGYKSQEDLRHILWSEECDSVPEKICAGHWNQPGCHAFDGIWYGIWQGGRYAVAREKEHTAGDGLEQIVLPAGRYAAFTTEPGGKAWEEFPKLNDLVFGSWLPDSGFVQAGDLAVEVLHLWTDPELRGKKRYYELWIPIAEK